MRAPESSDASGLRSLPIARATRIAASRARSNSSCEITPVRAISRSSASVRPAFPDESFDPTIHFRIANSPATMPTLIRIKTTAHSAAWTTGLAASENGTVSVTQNGRRRGTGW